MGSAIEIQTQDCWKLNLLGQAFFIVIQMNYRWRVNSSANWIAFHPLVLGSNSHPKKIWKSFWCGRILSYYFIWTHGLSIWKVFRLGNAFCLNLFWQAMSSLVDLPLHRWNLSIIRFFPVFTSVSWYMCSAHCQIDFKAT